MKIAVKIDSFRKLYDERYNHLVIYSEKLGVPSSVSEDIVQEAYVRLWENWKSVANPTAYLFRTVLNSSVDYFRTHSKLHSVTLESVPSFFLEDDALEDILEYFDKLEEISRKVESLPDKCREVIRKIYSLVSR